ncbi:hypothetical protein AAC387_Pa07g1700 [Persea americana]
MEPVPWVESIQTGGSNWAGHLGRNVHCHEQRLPEPAQAQAEPCWAGQCAGLSHPNPLFISSPALEMNAKYSPTNVNEARGAHLKTVTTLIFTTPSHWEGMDASSPEMNKPSSQTFSWIPFKQFVHVFYIFHN